jgi:hypothetical protein
MPYYHLKAWKLNSTLSDNESPFFSQRYVKDDGVVFRTKLKRPFIDFSHISLLPIFHMEFFCEEEIQWTTISTWYISIKIVGRERERESWHIKNGIVKLTSPFPVLNMHYFFSLESSFWTLLYLNFFFIPFYSGMEDGNINPIVKKPDWIWWDRWSENFPFHESSKVIILFLQLFRSSASSGI